MLATYAVGAAGLFIGFSTVNGNDPDLTLACFLAVGMCGLLSFVRHSLFHRSDAARMGWDYGRRNNFQIEVGFANLAWGAVAVLAAALGWGLAVESALFLVVGAYMGSVAVMQVFFPGNQGRATGAMIGSTAYAAVMLALGIMGMSAAT